ncbi:transcriptional regulator, IclR family [Natronincola peptidivorans]|uniref:Transcriptional regulator, IclR family n=1 Tax=Natronincola peptidivorans TaxID=426128 RepID=A0A1I0HAY1_9FIRM|nr:IclR family transcriptional regulator [Natronincola peptidivorans]SET79997.1 transcriptional regulator, IclR family [Natronincola peptidivorans]
MTSVNAENKKTIGSVIKAIEIMDLLTASEDELGATEISHRLNLNVSGTYHILNTLKACNIIEQNYKTKKYRLGLKLWKIGKKAREQNQLALFMKPYLKELRNLTNETANLTILDHGEIVYIAQEESDRLVKMFTKIGAKAPLFCSGAGKVLLAFQPKEKQRNLIDGIVFHKFTDKTIANAAALQQELEKIQQKGYAYDDEEREYGVSCIAAPIFDFDNEVIAAMSISGPTSRFHRENTRKWTEEILQLTARISSELGYKGELNRIYRKKDS